MFNTATLATLKGATIAGTIMAGAGGIVISGYEMYATGRDNSDEIGIISNRITSHIKTDRLMSTDVHKMSFELAQGTEKLSDIQAEQKTTSDTLSDMAKQQIETQLGVKANKEAIKELKSVMKSKLDEVLDRLKEKTRDRYNAR